MSMDWSNTNFSSKLSEGKIFTSKMIPQKHGKANKAHNLYADTTAALEVLDGLTSPPND
jgi:hypothetical protein